MQTVNTGTRKVCVRTRARVFACVRVCECGVEVLVASGSCPSIVDVTTLDTPE